jgi:pimeloyl-ACP methyl ester carboxylesterase
VIEAMGGALFVENNFARVKGGNEAGVAKFKENHAWDHYCHQFSSPECISGSCADYQAGATVDLEEQEADQKAGKKVKVPTLVLYSASNLGRMHDVSSIWEKWYDGNDLKTYGVPDGYGHFLPEECPDIISNHVLEWIDHVGK